MTSDSILASSSKTSVAPRSHSARSGNRLLELTLPSAGWRLQNSVTFRPLRPLGPSVLTGEGGGQC